MKWSNSPPLTNNLIVQIGADDKGQRSVEIGICALVTKTEQRRNQRYAVRDVLTACLHIRSKLWKLSG